jgi:bacterial/archaeal transporter family protein
MTGKWLVPTLGYVLLVGGLGVTSRLARRTLSWQDVVVWSGIGYVIVASVFLATGQARLRFTTDGRWAMGSAALAISGLVMLYVALGTGEATKVVTVSAAYPAATLLLAAAFLSEPVTIGRLAGLALVVGGVVVMTLAS